MQDTSPVTGPIILPPPHLQGSKHCNHGVLKKVLLLLFYRPRKNLLTRKKPKTHLDSTFILVVNRGLFQTSRATITCTGTPRAWDLIYFDDDGDYDNENLVSALS